MSHSRTIILGRTGEMKGNATTGSIVDMENAFIAVDDFLTNGDPSPTQISEMEPVCEELQDWLENGGKTANPIDTIDTFTTDLNAFGV